MIKANCKFNVVKRISFNPFRKEQQFLLTTIDPVPIISIHEKNNLTLNNLTLNNLIM